MIDEAFMPFREIIEKLAAFEGEIVDEEAGVRTRIYEFTIESPVELDVVRSETGELQIGSTPPLYRVDTSFRPTFHNLTFTAKLDEYEDGD
jgi:hypothetical protein